MSFLPADRAIDVEILDAGGYHASEMRGNLADLRFYNAWLGGARLVARGLERVLGADADGARARGGPGRASGQLTLLDVATGSGDIPAYLARWCAARGIDALVTGIDANADVIEEALRYHDSLRHGRSGGARPVRLLRADARRLPHADGSVDVAVCSNFLHHLDGATAVQALGEMRRVSRRGVVAVDLRRGALPYAGIWLLTRATTRNRLTRNDGPLSVQRAFTPGELAALAREAGLAGAEVKRDGPVRLALTWRRA